MGAEKLFQLIWGPKSIPSSLNVAMKRVFKKGGDECTFTLLQVLTNAAILWLLLTTRAPSSLHGQVVFSFEAMHFRLLHRQQQVLELHVSSIEMELKKKETEQLDFFSAPALPDSPTRHRLAEAAEVAAANLARVSENSVYTSLYVGSIRLLSTAPLSGTLILLCSSSEFSMCRRRRIGILHSERCCACPDNWGHGARDGVSWCTN